MKIYKNNKSKILSTNNIIEHLNLKILKLIYFLLFHKL